jgi:hypothetical protein
LSAPRLAGFQGARFQATAFVALAATLGCGVDFDPASKVNTLRVLAVQKDKPYARPGESVSLQLLWHDPRSALAAGPAPEIAWLAACENPPGDLFERCFEQFQTLSPEQLLERLSLPTAGATSHNDRFTFTTSADVIASRPPPKDPELIPYGITYVFFAICAGRLSVAFGESFPLLCYEERDGNDGFSAGDARLGPESFIVGYSAVFAYERVGNANPTLSGIEFNGAVFSSAPSDGTTNLPARDLCVGDSCSAAAAEDNETSCVDALTLDACDGCGKVGLKPTIARSSAETDTVASTLSGSTLTEQMWVNYYTSVGEVDDDVRLLNDAGRGWADAYGTQYSPGAQPGVGYLWAVAHDNRGGAQWLRLRICVR